MVSFSNVFIISVFVYQTVLVCWVFHIGVYSLEFLGLLAGWSFMYFVTKLWPTSPFLLQDSLFWEGPDTLVGSFTQNNCICFCSGPSRPNPCWVPIVLISRLALFDLRAHVYLGPFHQKRRIRFCFSCGDLKKKSTTPVKVGTSLDLSSCWRAWFSLSALALRLWTMWSWL